MRNSRTGGDWGALYELGCLIGIIISLAVGAYLSALVVSNPTAAGILGALFLTVLGIYAWFRFCFERNLAVLLCALDHIMTLQP